jgi:hypothetical protein
MDVSIMFLLRLHLARMTWKRVATTISHTTLFALAIEAA